LAYNRNSPTGDGKGCSTDGLFAAARSISTKILTKYYDISSRHRHQEN